MRKTYKYRLLPTKKQGQKLQWTIDMCRILYNSCLLYRRNNYEQTGRGLTRIRQQEILKSDKERIEFLNDIHSQVLQDVLFRVERAFQCFFRRLKEKKGKAGYPRFKGEGRYNSITYPQRSDFHHKVSRKIVDTYGFIAVEDLNIKGMVRNHHLAKSISDAGWGQFLNYLTYKAEEAGGRVEAVAPHYTSIMCSKCGNLVPKAIAQRIHRCPFCKTVMDRDYNAAINILNKSTAGTAGSNAWGEEVYQCPSMNQEAPSVRAG